MSTRFPPERAGASLRVSKLTIEYAHDGYVVRPIRGLDAEAGDGELVLLLGPGGCGKTAFLRCLAGLVTPSAGTIEIGQFEVTALAGSALADFRRRVVGIVPRGSSLISSLTARQNLISPLRIDGASRRRARARAEELLERVGLADRRTDLPEELSGGQRQRLAIARALVHDPPLMLADEPTARLGYVEVEKGLELLRELASPGRLVVLATQEQRLRALADRVIDLTPRAPAEDRARTLSLAAGELLFRQGDDSDLVYVVERGRIEVYRESADGFEEPHASFGPGEHFGELGPLLSLPRSMTARATETTVLTSWGAQAFRAWRAAHPGSADPGSRGSAAIGRRTIRADQVLGARGRQEWGRAARGGTTP